MMSREAIWHAAHRRIHMKNLRLREVMATVPRIVEENLDDCLNVEEVVGQLRCPCEGMRQLERTTNVPSRAVKAILDAGEEV